ncbi:MAG: hypothetical protein ACD_42C00446G0003, partial [uncultured bacterium]
MNLSKLFIQRPVATTVIMLALVIAGFFSYFKLPVSELPNIDFPTLVVVANLPGADPQTMATTVATPIEKELSTVSGIDSMISTSTAGETKIVMQFKLNRDINSAAGDVQSALLQIAKQLPSQLSSAPMVKKVNPAAAPILLIALTAGNVSMTALDNFSENDLSPNLSMISGVASVNVFGAQQYALRIHIDPTALQSRGLSLSDVSNAINSLNANQATGTLQTTGFYHQLKVNGGLDNAKQFGNAIISVSNGMPIRLKEVATLENSVANDKAITMYNNQRAIVLAIQRQPGSNTISVVNDILKRLPALSKQIPGGSQLHVLYNRATFIQSAVDDVEFTLIFAVFLVVAVIYAFFKNSRLTNIVGLSLPISVIATFSVMYLMGYSLDNLSLMGLVLVVGFVIDDAVVVLENIMRYVEQGMDKVSASLRGTQEVSFTVLAMTISLVAVFIPIFFMGGIIGRLFHEFSGVVGIAILFSAFVALSLIPMLCSRYLNHGDAKTQPASNDFFSRCQLWYADTLRWALDNARIIILIAIGTMVGTIFLFCGVNKGFIPPEDAGVIFGGVKAPEGIAYQDFLQEQTQAKLRIQQNPNVVAVMSSVGQAADGSASTNTGHFFIKLKPLSERHASSKEIIQQLKKSLRSVAGLKVFLNNPPAINIGGKISNGNYQYVLQGMSWSALESASTAMKQKLKTIPGVTDVDSDLQMNNPEFIFHILRKKAAVLGVTPALIESTLYQAYGETQVSTIMRSQGDYDVIMNVAPQFQQDADAVNSLYLKSSTGNMVPMSDVVRITQGAGPLMINHYRQLPAVTLSFNLQPGFALGQVVSHVQMMAKQTLPNDVVGSFTGTAQKFQSSLKTLPLLLLATVLVIYMVLAILYENFIHPLTILTALPFAVFGALLCLYLFGLELDIFSFIGLIMLVGITKKNGIIMVDFALDMKRTQNISAKEAIMQACVVRFRPIMMTTVCAIAAALPLAFGLGAGGETREGL